MYYLKMLTPLLLFLAAVYVIRHGGPRGAWAALRERIGAAGEAARERGATAWYTSLFALTSSWWVRLGLALVALALAGAWDGLLVSGTLFAASVAGGYALTLVPFIRRYALAVARAGVWYSGVASTLATVAYGWPAGGVWGYLAASLGAWAAWGAIQNRTIKRALDDAGGDADRVIDVRDISDTEGGGGHGQAR